MAHESAPLTALADDFMKAFNDQDFEAVMAFFTEDAVFESLRGEHCSGKEAIAAAFKPLLEGANSRFRFDTVDTFEDTEAGKVMTSWTLTIEQNGKSSSLSGLDLLHFKDGKITHKLAYAKAETPLYTSS